jgi:hypothetical protein
MRRCYRCGERLSSTAWPEGDEEERRPPARRDTTPNRGGMLLTTGVIGLICFPVCGLLGLILSLCAWLMGRSDLAQISAGTMDGEGKSNVESAILCGKIGVPLNILWLLLCLAYWVLMPDFFDSAPIPQRPRFGEPPRMEQDNEKWDQNNLDRQKRRGKR